MGNLIICPVQNSGADGFIPADLQYALPWAILLDKIILYSERLTMLLKIRSNVFRKNEDKMIGLKSIVLKWLDLPALGMKTTIVFHRLTCK